MGDDATVLLLEPKTIVWKDQTIKYAPIDNLSVRANFEAWMVEEAAKEMRGMKSILTPAEFIQQWDTFGRDVRGKQYKWGSENWERFWLSAAGQRKLIGFMIAVYTPEFKQLDELYEDPQRDDIVKEMLGLDDPNLLLLGKLPTTTKD